MKRKNLPEKIFLTGFMGAGKSSVGAILARITDVPFWDLDFLLCERESMRIEDIMSSLGEAGFRKRESELLAEVCSLSGAAVVSTGGGVVISQRNRRIMEQSGIVIYLKAKFETLMNRISNDKKTVRPLLKVSSPVSRAADIFSGREQFYETAGLTVETDGLCARDVAEKVAEVLYSDGIRKKSFEVTESGK